MSRENFLHKANLLSDQQKNEEYLDLISYQYDLLNLSLVHFYQKILIEEKRKINKTARQLEELISQIE